MPIHYLDINDFIQLAVMNPVIDVRSPGEYLHAHIPGSYSLPIFNDEERKIIGTTYKQQSREKAIKTGLDFWGTKMRASIEEVEKILKQWDNKDIENTGEKASAKILLHCWRGGMRSGAMAWLLSFYGYDVYLLKGGYKAYRNDVMQQFEKDYAFNILGGYTGSGKTGILLELHLQGQQIIDLEAIARHKGSAFGGIGQPVQPSQEMFENLLAKALAALPEQKEEKPTWLEDESQRIGKLNIPHALWNTMRRSPVFFLDIDFNNRLKNIVYEYSVLNKTELEDAILRIQKRLGPLETKTAIASLQDDNITGCFEILLKYYDKSYEKSLHNRENISELLNKISCSGVDAISNTQKIISCELQYK